MQSQKAFFAVVVILVSCAQRATAQQLGAQGAESEPNRMQQWRVPSSEPDATAHALLFRPEGDGPFRLALIAHASTEKVLRRAQMPQPEYRALAAWPVAGVCGAGAGTAGAWRDRRKISRRPGRLRRGRLFPRRGRHRRGNRCGTGVYARAILCPAGRHGRSRALGRRMGRAAVLTPDLWIEPLGALVKTGPAIVLMLVALLTLDNR
jgi:hypothetical protein